MPNSVWNACLYAPTVYEISNKIQEGDDVKEQKKSLFNFNNSFDPKPITKFKRSINKSKKKLKRRRDEIKQQKNYIPNKNCKKNSKIKKLGERLYFSLQWIFVCFFLLNKDNVKWIKMWMRKQIVLSCVFDVSIWCSVPSKYFENRLVFSTK